MRLIERLAFVAAALVVLAALVLTGMIWLGPARTPAPLASAAAPFRQTNPGDLPPQRTFAARDGTPLAFRMYPSMARRAVIAVHGASGRGADLHTLARLLAFTGAAIVYVPDIRGHGASGAPGDIGYLGQLDEDVADLAALARSELPGRPLALLGFSSGGGFALRIAGQSEGDAFAGFVLLAPYLGERAPTSRPGSGLAVNGPRTLALGVLHRIGIRLWDGLPVLRFAPPQPFHAEFTPSYSYRLAGNFGPPRNLAAALRRSRTGGRAVVVLDGTGDEVMLAGQYEPFLRGLAEPVKVRLVAGVTHGGMIADPRALDAVVTLVRTMPEAKPSPR